MTKIKFFSQILFIFCLNYANPFSLNNTGSRKQKYIILEHTITSVKIEMFDKIRV
jgi:hypothetical protein